MKEGENQACLLTWPSCWDVELENKWIHGKSSHFVRSFMHAIICITFVHSFTCASLSSYSYVVCLSPQPANCSLTAKQSFANHILRNKESSNSIIRLRHQASDL